MKIIYWCEFPDQVDWEKLASWLHEEIVIYVACTSRNNYENKKKTIQEYSKNIEVNAWPTCPMDEGYWFSSFSSQKTIDRLDEYEGLKFKIDIEPPKPKKYNIFTVFGWLIKNFFSKPKNSNYLKNKILKLSNKSDIIVSTFPLPESILKRWGWVKKENIKYNFMHYSSFIPQIALWNYNLYYRWFMKGYKNDYFAVGLIGTGIFGTEPIYKDIKQLRRDVKFLQKKGANKFVFFRLGSIVEKGKEWFDATRL